jgi:hypothetical protein
MPGYLDQYGAGEEERNRIIIRSIVAVVVVVIVGSLSWYLLRNHHQESVVKAFLADVRRGDLQAAYRDWGCTASKPCSGYAFDKFSGDWGKASKDNAPDPAILGVTDSESCNSGVLLTVAVNASREEKLWVDKSAANGGPVSDDINFAPYPICPHKSPFAIMIHRTIGKLRKPLLR